MKAKDRQQFLQNAGSKDLRKYFQLMDRLALKDKRYERMLKNDLKQIKQNGGFLTGRSKKNTRRWSARSSPGTKSSRAEGFTEL